MILAICLDDNNGMMFGNKRQSRDAKVIEDIIENCPDNILYISEYSKTLLEKEKIQVKIIEEESIPVDGVCFIENEKIFDYINKADKLVIYKWNRKYPGDLFFNNWEKDWEKESSLSIVGKSHEEITKETYRRRDANV